VNRTLKADEIHFRSDILTIADKEGDNEIAIQRGTSAPSANALAGTLYIHIDEGASSLYIKTGSDIIDPWKKLNIGVSDGTDDAVAIYSGSNGIQSGDPWKIDTSVGKFYSADGRIQINSTDTADAIFWTVDSLGGGQKPLEILANGTIRWGSGAAVYDVFLDRSGVKTLRVTGSFRALAEDASTYSFVAQNDDDDDYMVIYGGGVLSWGDSGGDDINLQRTGTGELFINRSLRIGDWTDLDTQGSDPDPPTAGKVRVYSKADGLYFQLSDTTIVGPLS
jgi:hypothetical protein